MKKFALLFILLVSAGCAGGAIFPPIGANMSNPLAVQVDNSDPANRRLYVLNSDYKVSYATGSVHLVDITDPATPTLLEYANLDQFTGQAYLDTTTKLLYTPGRLSSNNQDTVDYLYSVNGGASLAVSNYSTGGNPFGIACCDTGSGRNRLFVASWDGYLDAYEIGTMARTTLSMTSEASLGFTLSGYGANRVAIAGTQAIVTNAYAGFWIVNLDDLGTAGAYPIAYYVADISSPRGIAYDGTYLYVVSLGTPGVTGAATLYVLDISSLPTRTDPTKTEYISSKETAGLLTATVELDGGDPEEIVVSTNGNIYISITDQNIVDRVDPGADPGSFSKAGTITVGDQPYGMALIEDSGVPTHLLIANSGNGSGGNSVSIVELTGFTTIATYQ